jgi:hypothetical protein
MRYRTSSRLTKRLIQILNLVPLHRCSYVRLRQLTGQTCRIALQTRLPSLPSHKKRQLRPPYRAEAQIITDSILPLLLFALHRISSHFISRTISYPHHLVDNIDTNSQKMSSIISQPHQEQPTQKKRKLALVKCERCRIDKQKVRKQQRKSRKFAV